MENQGKGKPGYSEKIEQQPSKGLNDWNDRLDENLESEDRNDTIADDNAKDFSEEFEEGKQSNSSED